MNRSADRIRLVYALLLSLIVTAMSLAFVAPSQAAVPLIYLTATSTTSPPPGPTPTLDGGPTLEGDSTLPELVEKDPAFETPTGDGTETESPSTGGPSTGDTPSGEAPSETPAPAPEPAPQPQPDPVESAPGDGSSSGGTDNGGTTQEPPPAGGTNTDTPTTNPAPGGQVEQPTGPAEEPSTGTTDPGTPGTNTGTPGPSELEDPAGPPDEPSPVDTEPGPLTLEPDVASDVVAGDKVELNLGATGGTGDFTYRVVAGALPPGLTLDPDTGRITGTVKHVGKHSFTVEVISGNVRTSHKYTIVVKERPLDIEAPPLEPARAGEPYKPVVLHTEGGKGPFTYSLKGSELAGGEAEPAPVQSSRWIGTAPNTLTGSSKLLDSGPTIQGVADSKSGGTVAGSSSHVGNLPAGMRLEGGVLTGEPEAHAAGTYTFTIVSTDRFGSTAEQEMTITVLSDGEPVPIPASELSETGSPAQLGGSDLDDDSRAAATVPETQMGPSPLILGAVVLAGGALFLFLRRRFTTGAHQ
ncbi:MAG TPA: putative Ig domain-containing protein [Arthrobacter sp.]|nr:putative Ig domain-containing protein [Arthrobacter sp.]